MDPSSGNNYTGSAAEAIHGSDKHHPDDEEPEIIESRISKTLSDRTTKIVIILVLLMLFAQPAFDTSSYLNTPGAADQSVKTMVDAYQSGNWTTYQMATWALIDQ